MQSCISCNEVKPLSAFVKDAQYKAGVSRLCNSCRNAARRAATAERKAIKRAADALVTHKQCSKCQLEKPLDQFGVSPKGKYGVRGECKSCTAIYLKKWNSANPEHRRKLRNSWRAANPEKAKAMINAWRQANYLFARAGSANQTALRKGDLNKITARDIVRQLNIQRKLCFWCLTRCNDDFHIDHSTPFARGGKNTVGNIVIACPPCNQQKRDKLPVQFKRDLAQKAK